MGRAMKGIIYIILFFSSTLLAQEYSKVRITADYTLWTRPYFTSTYATDSLPVGTEAEIINYEKKSQGYGVEVRILNDPNKGKTGWVYYHTQKDRRKLAFIDDHGNAHSDKIPENTSTFMDHFNEQEKLLETRKKKMALLPPNNDSISDLDQVISNIYNGNYIIDTENDNGGPFIPILRNLKNQDGSTSLERFYIPRNYSLLVSYIESINKNLYNNFNQICSGKEPQFQYEDNSTKSPDLFTPGCELLAQDAKNWDDDELFNCLNILREKVGGKLKAPKRKDVFLKMYNLQPEEQELLGSVLTLFGESRSTSDEEALIVMKTFDNRKKDAQKECKNANLLDVVLQSWQFSMWNNKDPNWKKAISLKEEEKGPPIEVSERYQLKRMAKIYKQFRNGAYQISSTDKKRVDKISHYRTRAMDYDPATVPSWGPARDSIPTIRVNQINIGSKNKTSSKVHHYFFEDVAWKFKFHPYRPKKNGEGKCY